MFLGGLWHGANWTFMLWGGLHGFYLSINHAFRHLTKTVTPPPALRLPLHMASVLLTFAATSFAWIVFRAPDLASARNVLSGLLGLGHSVVVSFSPLAAVTLALLFAMVWLMPNSMEIMARYRPALPSPYADQPVEAAKRLSWRPVPLQAAVYGLICIMAVLALSNLKPFIYFQF
jgi:alginate O-acetyltransferase complex protein AlgI